MHQSDHTHAPMGALKLKVIFPTEPLNLHISSSILYSFDLILGLEIKPNENANPIIFNHS